MMFQSGIKNRVREFTMDLKKIYLADIRSYYNNLATKLIIYGVVKKGTLKSRIHGENISLQC